MPRRAVTCPELVAAKYRGEDAHARPHLARKAASRPSAMRLCQLSAGRERLTGGAVGLRSGPV